MMLIVIQCTNTNMDGKWLDSSQLPTMWGRELPTSQLCVGTGYFHVRADMEVAEVYVPKEQLQYYIRRMRQQGIYKLSDFVRAIDAFKEA